MTDLMNSLHQREAPGWYAHLLDNRDFRVITSSEEAKEYFVWELWSSSQSIFCAMPKIRQGCNGGVCFCDDRDGCNSETRSESRRPKRKRRNFLLLMTFPEIISVGLMKSFDNRVFSGTVRQCLFCSLCLLPIYSNPFCDLRFWCINQFYVYNCALHSFGNFSS